MGLRGVDEDQADRLSAAIHRDPDRVPIGDADELGRHGIRRNRVRPPRRGGTRHILLTGQAVAIRIEGGVLGGIGVVDALGPDLAVVARSIEGLGMHWGRRGHDHAEQHGEHPQPTPISLHA